MRSIIIIIALLLAMASGTALGLPLQGSNDNATVVIFGSSRMPVEDENSTLEILKVDVGLMGADNASYQLLDQDGLVYTAGQVQSLSSGKQIVYFLTKMDSLFKLINVTPDGSDPIYINWWMTPNASNDRLKVRYYGVVDSSIYSAKPQEIVIQVSVQNIGAESINVTPFNFSLLDQWQWPYQPTVSNFDSEIIEPGSATSARILLGFYNLSPVVRPAYLVYDFNAPDQIAIDLEKDYVPLSDEVVYGAASAGNATGSETSAPAGASEAAPAAQTAIQTEQTEQQEQTAAADQAPASNASARVSSIKDMVAATEARLAATRQGLDQKNQAANETANSTAALSNSTATTL